MGVPGKLVGAIAMPDSGHGKLTNQGSMMDRKGRD